MMVFCGETPTPVFFWHDASCVQLHIPWAMPRLSFQRREVTVELNENGVARIVFLIQPNLRTDQRQI